MKLKAVSQIQILIALGVASFIILIGIAIGAAALGILPRGEAAPNTLGNEAYLSDKCGIPSEYLAVFNRNQYKAPDGEEVSPALIASIFSYGEHYDKNNKTIHWPSITDQWDDGPSTKTGTAKGPFQFKDATWAQYGMGGNVQNINDSARAAYNMFSQNIKAGKGDTEHKIRNAIANYNSDSEYVNRVYEHYIVYLKCMESPNGMAIGDKWDKEKWIRTIQQDWYNSTYNSKYYGNNASVIDKTTKMNPGGVVLHWTAGDSVDGAISAMTKSKSYVHLIIDQKGKVFQTLPINTRVRRGSGDGNSFAVGIELVSIASDSVAENDKEMAKRANDLNDPQMKSVINVIRYLESTYKISVSVGNLKNLKAKRGIFGHFQVQGPWQDKDEENGIKGCKGRNKSDPGVAYMKAVWNKLNLNVKEDSCI